LIVTSASHPVKTRGARFSLLNRVLGNPAILQVSE
jgi:hypothetical protein